jgi:hypothetical protein
VLSAGSGFSAAVGYCLAACWQTAVLSAGSGFSAAVGYCLAACWRPALLSAGAVLLCVIAIVPRAGKVFQVFDHSSIFLLIAAGAVPRREGVLGVRSQLDIPAHRRVGGAVQEFLCFLVKIDDIGVM